MSVRVNKPEVFLEKTSVVKDFVISAIILIVSLATLWLFMFLSLS